MSKSRQDEFDELVLANELLKEEMEALKQELAKYKRREDLYNEFREQQKALGKAMDVLYRVRMKKDNK